MYFLNEGDTMKQELSEELDTKLRAAGLSQELIDLIEGEIEEAWHDGFDYGQSECM